MLRLFLVWLVHIPFISCFRIISVERYVKPLGKSPPRSDTIALDTAASAWVPIVTTTGIDPSVPTAVEITGRKYVAWRDPLHVADDPARGWSVMDDVCPHRFAPLSEGRVDAKSGCIECPYHGWQFESGSGHCTAIPQQPNLKFTPASQQVSAASSHPVHFTNDMLWAYLPVHSSHNSSTSALYDQLPEFFNPAYNLPNMDAVVVDLPYSFDFAAENLIDPAHVPFAHHTLQGTRDDATFVNVEPLTSSDNATDFEIFYTDRTGKKFREGVISFRPPFHYSMSDNRTFGKPKPNAPFPAPLTRKLTLSIVPIKAGMTRLFLWAPIPRNIVFDSLGWFIHSYINTFLESDIWVHNIERYARMNPTSTDDDNDGSAAQEELDPILGKRAKIERKYAMMTPSDRAVTAWRKFWRKHMAHMPLFGAAPAAQLPMLSEVHLRDRYKSHIKHCKHCLSVLKNLNIIEKILPVVSLTIIALTAATKKWYVNVFGVLVYALGQLGIGYVRKMIMGKEKWETMSVARKDKR